MNSTAPSVHSRHTTAFFASLILAGLLSALQLALYLYGFEFDSNLYVSGPLPTVTALAWLAAAGGAAAMALGLPRRLPCDELQVPSNSAIEFAALLSAAALAGSLLMPVLTKSAGTDSLGNLLASSNAADNTARLMLLGSLVLAIPAAAHFVLRFAYRKCYPQSACALLLWAGFSALRVYFDMRYLLTSPRRIMHLVALAALMLFAIAEMRLARAIVSRRFYTAAASLTLVLAGCDGLCNLLLAILGYLPVDAELCTYALLFAAALYAGGSLASLAGYAKAPRSAPLPAEALSAEADEADASPADVASDGQGIDPLPEDTPCETAGVNEPAEMADESADEPAGTVKETAQAAPQSGEEAL